jgi:drug/metabolite transporter (DMT)-like permease
MSKQKAIVSMVLAAACWGLATVMSKGILEHIAPLTLLVVQLLTSISFLWTVVLAQQRVFKIDAQLLRLALTGLLNPGLAYTFGLFGLALSTASMATLLWAIEPVVILLLAALLLGERLARPLIGLSALALAGVALIAGIAPDAGAGSSAVGNLLILLGVLCCALYVILTRRMIGDHDPLVLVALQQTVALAGAVFIWPVGWLRGELVGLQQVAPSVWAWASLSGITYYALAFWFYVRGLQQVPASMAAPFLNLIPLFGVAGAYVFLGERLGMVQWLGALLILVAVAVVVRLQEGVSAAPVPEDQASVEHARAIN